MAVDAVQKLPPSLPFACFVALGEFGRSLASAFLAATRCRCLLLRVEDLESGRSRVSAEAATADASVFPPPFPSKLAAPMGADPGSPLPIVRKGWCRPAQLAARRLGQSLVSRVVGVETD